MVHLDFTTDAMLSRLNRALKSLLIYRPDRVVSKHMFFTRSKRYLSQSNLTPLPLSIFNKQRSCALRQAIYFAHIS